MKYKVTVTEIREAEVEVCANSAEEAEEQALIMLSECEIGFPEYFNGENIETAATPMTAP